MTILKICSRIMVVLVLLFALTSTANAAQSSDDVASAMTFVDQSLWVRNGENIQATLRNQRRSRRSGSDSCSNRLSTRA